MLHRERRRSARTVTVRLRRLEDGEGDGFLRLVLTRRDRTRPRLTRPAEVDDAGAVTLRLTAAGRRYLRRRAGVTVHALDGGELLDFVDAVVVRR